MLGDKFGRKSWIITATLVLAGSASVAQTRAGARGAGRGAARTGATTAAATDAPAPPMAGVDAVAGDVCIVPARATSAMECPTNAVRFGTHTSTAPPAGVRATADEHAHTAQATARPTVALSDAQRGRQQNLQARSEEILRNEVRLTATLARQTPATDASRPNVLMRLSEALQELSSLENGKGQALNEDIFRARTANNTRQVSELERQQQGHQRAAAQFRQQMISTFETLIQDHPNYPRMDSVLFYLAFAYQDANDMTHARQIYQTLIQRFPQSDYLPNAYLSFAEYYFETGEMDPAGAFYERVLGVNTATINPGNNPVFGYALYKLAWVRYNQQQFDESLNDFFRVIDYGKQHPEVSSTASLLRSARTELVTAYGQVYGAARPLRTAEALATFQRYGADENNAFEMLEKLGELYQDNGQWPNSVAVYHELMARRPRSDSFCKWESQVAKAIVASRPRPQQMEEVQRLIRVYDSFKEPASGHAEAVQNQCRDFAARVVFDVASHWHLETIGRSTEGQVQTRGTRDATTMANASQLYQDLLDHFPTLDQVTYPDYNQTDWPTRYRVAYYRADLLRDMGNLAACGPAYDAVVEMNPAGEYTEDAAYKAVLCYNDLFSSSLSRASTTRPTDTQEESATTNVANRPRNARHAEATPEENAARYAPREFNPSETQMLRAFTRYVCFAGAAAASTAPVAAGQENPRTVLLTIKYRRAYLYYNARKFEEAATLFHDIAFSDATVPDPENLREIAGDLYLDSLNVMGNKWSPPRPACYDRMTPEVPRLKEAFCGAATRAAHTEFCDRMDLLGCQILRKRAESLHTAHRFREAGDDYVGIVRDHPECRANTDVPQVLYNAAIEYDAAFMLARAMRVRERLVELFLTRNNQYAQRALYRLAMNYVAIQVFGNAATNFERYADYVLNHRQEAVAADEHAIDQAADAIRQATIYRIGLGEEQHALDNAAMFARYFGTDTARRRQTAGVVFAIGQVYQDRAARLARQTGGSTDEQARRRGAIRDAWQNVVRHYTGFVNTYASTGTTDQKIQGYVAVARGYWNLDNEAQALVFYRNAINLWAGTSGSAPAAAEAGATATPAEGRDNAPGIAAIRHDLQAEPANVQGEAIEKSRDAIAEARFYTAEVTYRRFKERHLPAYRGGSNERAFTAWTTTALTPYIQQQVTYLQHDATEQYTAVINMHVPNWEIAAAARLADMFNEFSEIVRNSPIAPSIRSNADLLDAYRLRLDELTAPMKQFAETGYNACITRATTVHWFNEWSQLCERNLNAINARTYPIADEVRAEPTLVYSRPANGRAVYDLSQEAAEEEQGGGTPATNNATPATPTPTPAPGAPQSSNDGPAAGASGPTAAR